MAAPDKKLFKEFVLPPIEFIKYQLNFIINVPIYVLNDTNLTVLAYVYMYGSKAKNKIVSDRILMSFNSCVNYMSTLKRQGYLIADPENKTGFVLNPKLKILDEDYTQLIIVRKDQTTNEVYHRHFKSEDD